MISELSELGQFALRVLRSFRRNQGLLLAGAVAYYVLLSMVPLFTLLLVVLSQFVDESYLLATLDQQLRLILPGRSELLLDHVRRFLEEREVVGWLMAGVLLFFSSLAFSVLESAMAVIFHHRPPEHRHFLVSAVIPYIYILVLGVGFLLMTAVATALQTLSETQAALLGIELGSVALVLLYLSGLAGQILILTSIYLVMPVGTPSWRKALLGGIAAGLVWEVSRRILVWYFSTLSFVNVVYGSFATVVFLLLSLEVAALVLLLGAQVIAEYERLDR